jgi:asparagine synthase (glutamine-hydrolysing)
MRDGWTKYLARLAFDGKLPDEINWRKDKMGWPIPEKKWFYGNLNRWFIENIESCKLSKKLSFKEKENKRFSNNIKRMNLSIWEKSFLNNLD